MLIRISKHCILIFFIWYEFWKFWLWHLDIETLDVDTIFDTLDLDMSIWILNFDTNVETLDIVI